jgi:hypothetical protein
MINPVTTILFEKKALLLKNPESKVYVDLVEIQQFQLKQFMSDIRPMNEQKYAQFSKRFNRGDRCFVALADGVPCHFTWVRMHGVMSISSANKSFTLGSHQAWVFDCRTNENYRGLSIYPHVISNISNDLLKSGLTSVMIDATKDNNASVHGILKAGFTPVKKIWRLGSLRWTTNLK